VSDNSKTKAPLTRLSELRPGDRGDFFALLAERKHGVTQTGKPYFHCRFRDARRTVSFMAWGDDKWYAPCERDWQVGQFFKIRGVYSEHERYGPQIELLMLRPVSDADREAGFDESDFVESSRHDPAQMWTELRTLATKHVADEALRGLVLALLDEHAERLRVLPATRDRAYPYRGGWLEHVLSVTRVALHLAEHYALAWPDLRPPLNRDLIVAGALLHDLGRVRELDDAGPTVPGRLFGHALLGRDLVRDAAHKRGLDGELLTLLEHVLLTPSHAADGIAAKMPLVPEGLIVQQADELDLRMASAARALLRDAGPGPFTERDPTAGRLLKARGV
jgi:3'-5' exoribonuclease